MKETEKKNFYSNWNHSWYPDLLKPEEKYPDLKKTQVVSDQAQRGWPDTEFSFEKFPDLDWRFKY